MLATSGEGNSLTTARARMEAGQSGTTRLQHLYELGLSTFRRGEGSVPSREEVAVLLQALQDVPIEELGLAMPESNGMPQTSYPWTRRLRSRLASSVTYLPVQEVMSLHIGVFCLPANATIPLHDHPGMTVLSRVLYGRVQITSYDWLPNEGDGIARMVADEIISGPTGTSILFPTWANVHSLTALTPCAVLDILAPPYAPAGGRDCTYFLECPIQDEVEKEKLGQGSVRLQACDPPDDFEVRRGQYTGVRVQE